MISHCKRLPLVILCSCLSMLIWKVHSDIMSTCSQVREAREDTLKPYLLVLACVGLLIAAHFVIELLHLRQKTLLGAATWPFPPCRSVAVQKVRERCTSHGVLEVNSPGNLVSTIEASSSR
jgi:hypothetical protein